MDQNKCLKIAAFLDGSPGHEKQTQGIINQLKKHICVEQIAINIEKTSLLAQFLDWCRFFNLGNLKPEMDLSGIDLLIGTGTHTHLPMLLHKKKYNIPVVSCMTPSPVLTSHFDLLFVPYHDKITVTDRVLTTIGPPSSNENSGMHDWKRVLILIGGTDQKSHLWNTTTLVSQIESLLAHDSSKKIIISSSPRTPAETVEKIEALSMEYENAQFFEFKNTKPGWVEKEYGRSKYVWVTGDSISMVYEALSSGCCVGIIPVVWRSKSSKYLKSENYLIDNCFVVKLETYLTGQACWVDKKVLNEAERCAEEIIRRWA